MSGGMSTPVNSLPPLDGKTSLPSVTNDPVVNDVLAEMEHEVAEAKKHSMPNTPTHVPMPTMQPQYLQHSSHMHMQQQMPLYMKGAETSWIDTALAKNAIAATLIAMLLLLPNISTIYERFSRIGFLEPYELYIRAAMLALVLYILMVRLNM